VLRNKILWVGSILILINIYLFFVTKDYKLINEALVNVSIAISMYLLSSFSERNKINRKFVIPFILLFITTGILRIAIGFRADEVVNFNYIILLILLIPVFERVIFHFIIMIDNSDKPELL
jgi:hypothetical protein